MPLKNFEQSFALSPRTDLEFKFKGQCWAGEEASGDGMGRRRQTADAIIGFKKLPICINAQPFPLTIKNSTLF
jgi:hypothetical protein